MARTTKRKVDVFKFKKDVYEVTINIYMVRDTDDQTIYKAAYKQDNPPIDVKAESHSIDIVRKTLELGLSKQLGLKWEDWMIVRVSGERFHPGGVKLKLQNGLDVNYTMVQIAEVGPDLYIHRYPDPGFSGGWQGEFKPGRPETQIDRVHDKESIRSLIKATPENIAAVESIMKGIDVLRDRIGSFLRQDMIQATLDNIKNTPLLPG